MKIEQMNRILDKIKAYDRIVLFRHIRPDGDAVGSTKGLQEILRLTYPKKDIRVLNTDSAEYLRFLGDEDEPQPDSFFGEALGIVLDTATAARISNPQYAHCRELCRIDHHIDVDPYANIAWIEETCSSTCEMIAAFYDTFRDELQINTAAATYLYTGMVTDSGRFRYRSVSGETLRLSGMLLDQGVDAETLYAHLYMKDIAELRFGAYVVRKMKITEHGVAYLYVDRAMQKKFHLNGEQASDVVTHMESIKDSLIWIAFVEGADKKFRVRLRSRFVTINDLASRYHGGGHACASGATVSSKKEARALLQEADALLCAYKADHTGWL